MKKNNMLRIASVLLVAVLLSTCAISGAFAKYYTTQKSDAEVARVAKFGVAVSAGKPDMFAGSYEAKEIDFNGTEDGLGASVSATTDVLAPGTAGTLANYVAVTDSTNREVAVNVAYAVEVAFDDAWGDYCPIVFTVDGTDYYVGKDDTMTDAESLVAKVNAAASSSTNYAVGSLFSSQAPAISWRWMFDNETATVDDQAIIAKMQQTDAKDTTLGEAGAAKITIAITATVTQID